MSQVGVGLGMCDATFRPIMHATASSSGDYHAACAQLSPGHWSQTVAVFWPLRTHAIVNSLYDLALQDRVMYTWVDRSMKARKSASPAAIILSMTPGWASMMVWERGCLACNAVSTMPMPNPTLSTSAPYCSNTRVLMCIACISSKAVSTMAMPNPTLSTSAPYCSNTRPLIRIA